jgi:hypothetical protein
MLCSSGKLEYGEINLNYETIEDTVKDLTNIEIK